MYRSRALSVVGLMFAWVMSQRGLWYVGSMASVEAGFGRKLRILCTSVSDRPGRACRIAWGAVLMLMRGGSSALFVVVSVSNMIGSVCCKVPWSASGLLTTVAAPPGVVLGIDTWALIRS